MKSRIVLGHLTIENTVGEGRPVRVFLDGVEQELVVECHTEEGG